MKRLLFLLGLLLAFAAAPTRAQVAGAGGPIAFIGVPTGGCNSTATPVDTAVDILTGNFYLCFNNNWILLSNGSSGGGTPMSYCGVWSPTTTYPANCIVSFQGSSYVAVQSSIGVTPGTNVAVWGTLAAAGTNGTNGTNGANGTPGYSPNQISAGCGIEWTGGYNFTIGACSYFIVGQQYNSPLTNITLAAADTSHDRIDTIAVDNTGSVVVLTGTPSVNPSPPSVNLATQLSIGFVYVTANTTQPVTINSQIIYLNNTGWTCTAGTNFNCASTNNPYTLTYDIEATTAALGNNVTLVDPSNATVNLQTYNALVFYIASKAAWTGRQLSVQWYNAGVPIGNAVVVTDGNFNFNSSLTNYQQVSIPTQLFGTNAVPVTTLVFSVSGQPGTSSTIGFYMDEISLQSGATNPILPSNLMVYLGSWNNTTQYVPNDVVVYQGNAYVSISASANQVPTNTTYWTALASSSGTVNPCGQYGVAYYSGVGVGTTLTCAGAPTGNGLYALEWNVTGAVSVPPTASLFGMGGRSITGGATTDTTLYSDNGTTVTHDVGATQNLAVTLPTATTLGNPNFVYSYANHSSHTDTITPTTWTIQQNASAAASSMTVSSGQFCRIKVDPNSSTNWLADCPGTGSGSGTVTSVATTSPITGGTITTTGTIACATCVTASSPGAGVAHFAGSTQAVTSSAVTGSDMANNTVTATQLAAQYSKLRCETGLGDGLNAMSAGTYLQTMCYNDSGVTWTITGIKCFTDNGGSSTLNATDSSNTALLTGAITCGTTWVAGTLGSTTTIANGGYIKFTFVADGSSKQTSWLVSFTQ